MTDPVLNELSLFRFREARRSYATASRAEARVWMNTLVQTLAATARIGLPRSLRTLESFAIQQITPDYNVAQWRNDSQVNRDLRQLFRSYVTKSPLLDGVLEALAERVRGCEGKFEGVECKGLLVAHLLDCLAISLPSDPAWGAAKLDIRIYELEASAGLLESNETVLHASTPEHVVEHTTEFQSRRRSLVATGRDLVERREQLLPNIRFCSNVEASVVDLGRNDPRLVWLERCLFELNDHCNNWSEGEFPHERLRSRASPNTVHLRLFL